MKVLGGLAAGAGSLVGVGALVVSLVTFVASMLGTGNVVWLVVGVVVVPVTVVVWPAVHGAWWTGFFYGALAVAVACFVVADCAVGHHLRR